MRVPTRVVAHVVSIEILLVCFASIFCRALDSAQCQVVPYRKGRDFSNLVLGSLQISVPPEEFTLNKLTCLAQSLRKQHAGWRACGIAFFSSHDAAKYWLPKQVEGYPTRWAEWSYAFHADYEFDAAKHEEYLNVFPLGSDKTPPSLVTRFDLPLTTAPRCRMEIGNRCLMAVVEEITYPQGALKANATGTVVLRGTIKRNGRVTRLEVAEADVNPREQEVSLTKAALRNLKTWQFDAAERHDPIQISYTYVIDTSLPHGTPAEVQWALPNQVTIRGNPP